MKYNQDALFIVWTVSDMPAPLIIRLLLIYLDFFLILYLQNSIERSKNAGDFTNILVAVQQWVEHVLGMSRHVEQTLIHSSDSDACRMLMLMLQKLSFYSLGLKKSPVYAWDNIVIGI